MSRLRLALLLLPFALLTMAFRQAPLVNPPPIAVTTKMSTDNVLKAIKMALVHRGWTITELKPGIVDSTLNLRDHTARIEIDYSTTSVQIKYLDSTNLKYEVKSGTPYIHKNYLGWIENLTNDIQGNLLLLGN
ncbi:MAG: hypothetical protein JSR27_09300 [Proteobacteria bacterium]|nr:hypothetical protein [Pseudomonadota bacterium]